MLSNAFPDLCSAEVFKLKLDYVFMIVLEQCYNQMTHA